MIHKQLLPPQLLLHPIVKYLLIKMEAFGSLNPSYVKEEVWCVRRKRNQRRRGLVMSARAASEIARSNAPELIRVE